MSTSTSSQEVLENPAGTPKTGAEYYWLWVLCVLGLDYFSTLAYQPSITFHETRRLGPLATAAVVLVTLFGALPVYCYLAGRSPGGQGALGILEQLVRGWRGKTLVLMLLGFAATDFTMLKSLSLADAAVHVLNKQDGVRAESTGRFVRWLKACADEYCTDDVAPFITDQLVVTIGLGIIATVFWFLLRKGFTRNVMVLAVPLVALYLLMTGILIAGGFWFLYEHPVFVTDWYDQILRGEFEIPGARPSQDGWWVLVWMSLLALPNLALGLSGFEMGMILMPQVKGKSGEHPPRVRIHNTRKVLVLAALIMSVFLLGSVFVTTLVIPSDEFVRLSVEEGPVEAGVREGHANDRALAYLAHGGATVGNEPLLPICGIVFGTLYDVVTVLILCLAGTSVMTALAALLPLFLLRFGMEFKWTQRWGLLLFAFAAINVLVTLWFHAKVEDQRGAYATGVLVMITCAALVTVADKRRAYRRSETKGWFLAHALNVLYHLAVAAVFVLTTLAVVWRSPSGLGIAFCFIAAILGMSILSRAWRADEMRTIGAGRTLLHEFKDATSEALWEKLRLTDFPALVLVRPGRDVHAKKEAEIRQTHQLDEDAEVVFLEVYIDDPSDFFQKLMIEVVHEDNRYTIRVTRGVSIAHAIAAIAIQMSRDSKPPTLHFGWPEMSILSASWSYLAFGEGNIAWKVRELIHSWEKDPAKRPRVIVG